MNLTLKIFETMHLYRWNLEIPKREGGRGSEATSGFLLLIRGNNKEPWFCFQHDLKLVLNVQTKPVAFDQDLQLAFYHLSTKWVTSKGDELNLRPTKPSTKWTVIVHTAALDVSLSTCRSFERRLVVTVGYGYKGWLGTGENCTIYPHYPVWKMR